MDKKIKTTILMIAVYLLVFLIGFKSGAAYLRMKKTVQIERLQVDAAFIPKYYVVEKRDYGSYSTESIEEASDNTTIVKVFNNEKLRPLLKSRNIKIYTGDGERVY